MATGGKTWLACCCLTSRPLDLSTSRLMRSVPGLLRQPRRVPAHSIAEPTTFGRTAADRAEPDAFEPALAALVRLQRHWLAPAAAQCVDQCGPPVTAPSPGWCDREPWQFVTQPRLA